MNLGANGRACAERSLFGALAIAAAAVSLALPANAKAAVPAGFTPCSGAAGFYCGSVSVPLDRSGLVIPTTTTVNLKVMIMPARVADTGGAIVALAGGPGQAATPHAGFFAAALYPFLGTHDLIVFDQRGTGGSGALDCPGAASATSLQGFVEECASEIGPARAYYASKDSAEDIDAVRAAVGVDKLTVFGVSYGTYVAQLYARLFPAHTSALVLDSVVPSTGIDAFLRNNFLAIRKVLSSNCSRKVCRGITGTPYSDFKRLVRRSIAKRSLKLHYVDSSGRVQRLNAGQVDLMSFMVEGFTYDAVARARFPSAVRSALAGDPYPLGRLLAPVLGAPISNYQFSTALFLSTTCTETSFPWTPSDPISVRESKASGALGSISQSIFSPFTPQTALSLSVIPICAYWPAPQQPVDASVTEPAPDVPVLLLDGEEDDLTPASNGIEVASLFPHATRVGVPFTGHSVISDVWPNASTCVGRSLTSFFAGNPVASCRYVKPFFRPIKRDPTRLRKVKHVGVKGARGRTVGAVLGTLSDVTMTALSGMENNAGLHGGRFSGSLINLRLRKIVYVPGVIVSGRFDVVRGKAALRIKGEGARGKLTVHRYKKFTRIKGTLDGEKIRIKTRTSSNDRTVAAKLPGLLGMNMTTRAFVPISSRVF
jgi:pimeloyl-ACP methyl ester carboxylesterase